MKIKNVLFKSVVAYSQLKLLLFLDSLFWEGFVGAVKMVPVCRLGLRLKRTGTKHSQECSPLVHVSVSPLNFRKKKERENEVYLYSRSLFGQLMFIFYEIFIRSNKHKIFNFFFQLLFIFLQNVMLLCYYTYICIIIN